MYPATGSCAPSTTAGGCCSGRRWPLSASSAAAPVAEAAAAAAARRGGGKELPAQLTSPKQHHALHQPTITICRYVRVRTETPNAALAAMPFHSASRLMALARECIYPLSRSLSPSRSHPQLNPTRNDRAQHANSLRQAAADGNTAHRRGYDPAWQGGGGRRRRVGGQCGGSRRSSAGPAAVAAPGLPAGAAQPRGRGRRGRTAATVSN